MRRRRLLIPLLIIALQINPDIIVGSQSDSIPVFPDLVYEYRITALNHLTPIELEYNDHVRRFIDVYTVEQREHLAEIAGRSKRYFPIIEEELDKYNLPLELKYLAIVESALDPFAVSKSGAMGLWQFKLNTSRMFDLTVNSYIDERRDPYLSTEAACKYLKYLYRLYNDWQLALAAYNGGPGVIRKAIARSGGEKSFWELYPYLPAQTKSYVPAFIAVNYAMNHLDKHQIIPKPNPYPYAETDTLHIHYALSFENITDHTGVPIDTLKILNPVYRKDYIPNMNQKTSLILPKNKVSSFLQNEHKLYSAKQIPGTQNIHIRSSAERRIKKKMLTHVVEKGEYFHKIAMKYQCTIEEIRKWNNLTNDKLHAGQKLNIWVDPGYIEKLNEEKIAYKNRYQADTNKRIVFYTVQKGDTIWSIADKFNCESIAQLIEANDIQDETDIKPGKKIKIYLNH